MQCPACYFSLCCKAPLQSIGRLCGMQVFNVHTGKYLCHNKYYGRGLTPEGFNKAIAQFFNNTEQPDQVTQRHLFSLTLYSNQTMR